MSGSTDLQTLVDDLTLGFSGPVLLPGEDGCETARWVHNGLIDERPAVILQYLHTADVVDAVNLGRESGWR